MRKAFKVFCVFLVSISLLSLSVIHVFAGNSNEAFVLTKFEVMYDGDWVNVPATWNASQGVLSQSVYETDYNTAGFRAEFISQGFVRVPAGSYFIFDVVLSSGTTPMATDKTISCTVIDGDGRIYSLTPSLVYDESSRTWSCSFGAKIGDGSSDLYLGKVYFESNFSSEGFGYQPYYIHIDFKTQTSLTPEQARLEQLIAALKANTDIMTEGFDDTTGDDVADTADGVIGQHGNAESEALGGKSDEEIKQEVSNALTGSVLPDDTAYNVYVVGSVFDSLLDSFGSKYQTVLVLALTLGLAAFLVGRSYRAKGD